jgi:hypothetical protein
MPHIQGVHRDAVMLFPPTLDEYITTDNPVRYIDAFVDELDLHTLGFWTVGQRCQRHGCAWRRGEGMRQHPQRPLEQQCVGRHRLEQRQGGLFSADCSPMSRSTRTSDKLGSHAMRKQGPAAAIALRDALAIVGVSHSK